jgi:hypothetical protein
MVTVRVPVYCVLISLLDKKSSGISLIVTAVGAGVGGAGGVAVIIVIIVVVARARRRKRKHRPHEPPSDGQLRGAMLWFLCDHSHAHLQSYQPAAHSTTSSRCVRRRLRRGSTRTPRYRHGVAIRQDRMGTECMIVAGIHTAIITVTRRASTRQCRSSSALLLAVTSTAVCHRLCRCV